ncbi:MAG: methyl-accepting chemotaxis protein [Clostridiales Family XIII bacterium]|jgi:methyl-accepting chemotaxis protein|nr:methyl-accepting chemotaxis protein [Clostridiales Family XIII bacterium]
MRNWKIKIKLLFGFLLVAVMTAVVGIIGIYGLVVLNATQEQMYIHVTNMDITGDVQYSLALQRIAYRDGIMYITDSGRVQTAIKDLESAEDVLDEKLKLLATTLMTETGKAQLAKITDTYSSYLVQLDKLKTQISAGDDKGARDQLNAMVGVASDFQTNVNELGTIIASTAAKANDYDSSRSIVLYIVLTAVAIGAVVIAVIFGIVISRLIATPIKRLLEAADSIAQGDINVNVGVDSRDEIGLLAKSFESMIDSIKEQADVLTLIADGDYRSSITVRSDKDVMNKSINTVVDKNNNLLLEIKEASAQVSAGAGQIATGAQSLASGSTEQAATLEEFSASISEVMSQSEDNTKKSQEAYDDVQLSTRYMSESMESMRNMTEAMQDINESSNNIAKVIKVIDDIAFQTNILALNAAVEAARAGQHGKGFAVVADEVRNLASKSAEAAKETAVLIENSTHKVTEGNAIAGKTSESLMSVNAISEKNALSMQSISTSSQMQSDAISEITKGISQISDVVQANSATAEQSAAAAQELSAQATMLEDIISQFRLREAGGSGGGASINRNAAPLYDKITENRGTPVIDLGGGFDKY